MKKAISIILVLLILATQLSLVFAYDDEEYYVQVGAFESNANAEKLTNYMIGIGYSAVTIKVFELYKVFLGPYDTPDRAREIADHYESIGGSGFFIAAKDMYYQPPVKKESPPVEDTTEEAVEDTTEEAVEDTTEEAVEDTTEEAVEETTEEAVEETTEEAVEETTEEAVEETTEEAVEETNEEEVIEVDVLPSEVEDEPDYKLFTIILIVMLWVLFIIILVVFRLNQNKRSIN